MKKLLSGFVVLTVFALFASCGPSRDEAIDYNDKIIEQQALIVDRLDGVYATFENYDPKQMDDSLQALKNQIESSLKNVNEMKQFDKDTIFKKGAIELFNVYKSITDNELSKIISYYKLPEDQFTTIQSDEIKQLGSQSENKIKDAFNKFKAIQDGFAAKYNFKFADSK